MWPWLLITASLNQSFATPLSFSAVHAESPEALVSPSPSLSPSPLPTVDPSTLTESALLRKGGKAAYLSGNYKEATSMLQRLVDRYPASPSYLEAQHELGLSYLRLGDAKKALKPLQIYIESSEVVAAFNAKPELAEAYLRANHAQEALLTSTEILSRRKSTADLRLKALLLKSRSLLALHQDSRATQALEAFKREAKKDPEFEGSDLKAPAQAADFSLKARKCALFPSTGQLDEAQVQNQMSRKGDCLLEAALLYKELLWTGSLEWTEASSKELESSYSTYHRQCRNPPPPRETGKKPRTAAQLKSYAVELSEALSSDCVLRTQRTLELLKPNDKTEPLPDALSAQVRQLNTRITQSMQLMQSPQAQPKSEKH